MSLTDQEVEAIRSRVRNVRENVLRMIHNAASGHVGGSLSAAEILGVLYFKVLRVDPQNPDWPERDRFVMSKGHASAGYYATLAEAGFISPAELLTFDCINSRLQGHPDKNKTPGVDMSTGSLGQGLSVGCGMALGARLKNLDVRVYVLLGDGELNEGQVWEAAMSAAKYGLDNLTAIVDRNNVQLVGPTEENMPLEPLEEKWKAFGWEVLSADGHDIRDLYEKLIRAREIKGKPAVLIARTMKGKGVSFMEGTAAWHSKAPSDAELAMALRELGGETGV
ncbi:MAG: transketolase [Bacillota bacterium]